MSYITYISEMNRTTDFNARSLVEHGPSKGCSRAIKWVNHGDIMGYVSKNVIFVGSNGASHC